MKAIDLLNKIANGEETPEKVKYGGIIYTRAVDYNTKEVIDYLNKCESLFQINDGFEYCFIKKYLDDEVEILEEEKKIPEKIDVWYDPIKDTELERHDTDTSIEILAAMCDDLKDKYNEIIDYLQSKGE